MSRYGSAAIVFSLALFTAQISSAQSVRVHPVLPFYQLQSPDPKFGVDRAAQAQQLENLRREAKARQQKAEESQRRKQRRQVPTFTFHQPAPQQLYPYNNRFDPRFGGQYDPRFNGHYDPRFANGQLIFVPEHFRNINGRLIHVPAHYRRVR